MIKPILNKIILEQMNSTMATLRRSRRGSAAVKCVTGRGKLLKTTGGVTTVMAVLTKTVLAPRLRCDGGITGFVHILENLENTVI